MAGWHADKLANCRLERPALLGILHRPKASLKKFHTVCSMRSDFSIPDHSTIRATFMWDRSIMCLWKFEGTVNTKSYDSNSPRCMKGNRRGPLQTTTTAYRKDVEADLVLHLGTARHITLPFPSHQLQNRGYLWNFC